MWRRFLPLFCCPACRGDMELSAYEEQDVQIDAAHLELAQERGLDSTELGARVDSGMLVCRACEYAYPIMNGLPILLPYTASVHKEFEREHAGRVRESLAQGFRFADKTPVEGERFVLDSFSTEWRNYRYDGVIWEMDYADHETRFLKEMGIEAGRGKVERFLEIGCGLGITTHMAQSNYGADAVGMDLGFAAMRATEHFGDNPFLQFAQGSAYALPFHTAKFDQVYSRGVLHHTYSTEAAFKAVADVCAPGGQFYLWVYGLGSINETPFRKLAYATEKVIRPILSRNASSIFARTFLALVSLPYVMLNRIRRAADPTIQKLTFERAVHAARDRFTPQFAHRHAVDEVVGWFEAEGYGDVHVVDWKVMPSADHDDYRRNVGVRGIRTAG